MSGNYRWEQCYEWGDKKLWAIVDDESARNNCVTSHLLVVNHLWANSLGRPFPDCELPQRIIARLNEDETELERALALARDYIRPASVQHYTDAAWEDLQHACRDAGKKSDSGLLEAAGHAIRHLRIELKRLQEKLENTPTR